MSSADVNSATDREPVTLAGMALRFPNAAIVSNPTLERWIINWVWATVPLQYYIFTRFPGGLQRDQWLAIVVSVVSCMLLILMVSSLLAFIVPMKDEGADKSYKDAKIEARKTRLRAWSVALITTWTAAVTLLALSYLIASLFGRNNDLVHMALCEGAGLTCFNHPHFFASVSYLIYFCYALAATVVVFVILRFTGGALRSAPAFPAPFTFAVVCVCAVLLNLLYSAAKLY